MDKERFRIQIFFQLDVRTVALFVALTFFAQATAIGAQAFLIRELKQYRGVGAALLANLCVAVGLMLRLFAERLPDFLTIILSNILILTGTGLFYIALSQFTGFSYSKAFVIGVIAIVLSFLLYFTYRVDDMGKRMITISLGVYRNGHHSYYPALANTEDLPPLQREPDADLFSRPWNISDHQNDHHHPKSPAGRIQPYARSIRHLSALVRNQLLLVDGVHPDGEPAPAKRPDGSRHYRCSDPHPKPTRDAGFPREGTFPTAEEPERIFYPVDRYR